jgi:hypothetical protein
MMATGEYRAGRVAGHLRHGCKGLKIMIVVLISLGQRRAPGGGSTPHWADFKGAASRLLWPLPATIPPQRPPPAPPAGHSRRHFMPRTMPRPLPAPVRANPVAVWCPARGRHRNRASATVTCRPVHTLHVEDHRGSAEPRTARRPLAEVDHHDHIATALLLDALGRHGAGVIHCCSRREPALRG